MSASDLPVRTKPEEEDHAGRDVAEPKTEPKTEEAKPGEVKDQQQEQPQQSKSSKKKEMKEQAKQLKKQQTKQPAPPKNQGKADGGNNGGNPSSSSSAPVDDPQQMFKTGFLHEVYNERPVGSEHISKVLTRFPPEPNGYLHIGHAKAIAVNFGFAKFHGGDCYLRYDDTNPKGEEQKYIDSILELVRWLGFKPFKVTYSSDYFDELYALAEKLILKDRAYVCHCSDTEVKAQRGVDFDDQGNKQVGKERFACAHRDRPVEESLQEFRAMQAGKYRAQEAFLRMKQDLNSPNPQMWDLAAYRVVEEDDGSFAKHLRSGDKWKVYPTYDFTHCLCDSFEHISHSLCTTEFETARESYEWLCRELEVFVPMQREYGRLNMDGTVLSKRKLNTLVKEQYVRGWDDPRLFTIAALRRRGVPPSAILSFVNEIGVSKVNSLIPTLRFERSIRASLEFSVPRLMLVLDPLRIVIDDLPDDYVEMVDLPYSKDPAFGSHQVPFTKNVFIERNDFREAASPDFFRLVLGGSVGLLRVPYPITATSFETDPSSGQVTVVHARYDVPSAGEKFKKPKAYIHWLAESPAHNCPLQAEARLFNPLFNTANPADFEADVNRNSEEVYPNALLDIGFNDIKSRAPWPQLPKEEQHVDAPNGKEATRFQAMRVAYFCEDDVEEKDGKIVLNRIVSLKEDPGKE